MYITCAEMQFKIDTGQIEYKCVCCDHRFTKHSECAGHVRSCLNLDEVLRRFVVDNAVDSGDGGCVEDFKTLTIELNCEPVPHNIKDGLSRISILKKTDEEIEPFIYYTSSIDEDDSSRISIWENSDEEDNLRISYQEKTDEDNIDNTRSHFHRPHVKPNTPKNIMPACTLNEVKRQSAINSTKCLEQNAVSNKIQNRAIEFSQYLLRGIRKKHPKKKRWIECDICGSCMVSRSATLVHMQRKHGAFKPLKRYCCEYCGITMTELGNLNVHKRIHTGERPFVCEFEECEQRFISSSDRTIHMRRHLGENPYKCDLCPKEYHKKHSLTLHVRKNHNTERPFRCKTIKRSYKYQAQCNNALRYESALRLHRNVHTDHRPFACKHCDRAFHSTSARRSHEKVFHKLP